jgi:hypothetical protein
MFKRTILIAVVALLLISGGAFAQYVPVGATPHINVAQMGMGGLTTVVASNAHTLFYNPGMLTRQKFAFEVTVPIGLDNDLLPMASFINDHQEDFQNFESLTPAEQNEFLEDSQEFDNKWVGTSMSPFVGLSWKNFGIGGYFNTNANLKLDQGVLVPAIGMRGYGDATVGVGFGKTLEVGRNDVGVGVTLRYLERYSIPTERISATEAASAGDIIQTMFDELESPATGFGIDVGAVQTLEIGDAGAGKGLDVAAVIKDLYGSIDGEYVKPNLQAGVMYHGTSGGFLLRRFDVGLEFTDLFNRAGASFWQKINAGTEMSVIGGLLTARAGIHQGYPTYGLGVRFLVVKLDVARFTRELGTAPGQEPDDQWVAQVSIGW